MDYGIKIWSDDDFKIEKGKIVVNHGKSQPLLIS